MISGKPMPRPMTNSVAKPSTASPVRVSWQQRARHGRGDVPTDEAATNRALSAVRRAGCRPLAGWLASSENLFAAVRHLQL